MSEVWVGCNACGNCCEDIPVNFTMKQLVKMAADPMNADDHKLKENAEKLPLIWYKYAGKYQCRMFDRKTRMCKDYENRPPICRDYPYYGGLSPSKQTFDCTFNKLLPIVKVT